MADFKNKACPHSKTNRNNFFHMWEVSREPPTMFLPLTMQFLTTLTFLSLWIAPSFESIGHHHSPLPPPHPEDSLFSLHVFGQKSHQWVLTKDTDL